MCGLKSGSEPARDQCLSEGKASSVGSPWKNSQALRTRCRTNPRGMVPELWGFLFLGWVGLGAIRWAEIVFPAFGSGCWGAGEGRASYFSFYHSPTKTEGNRSISPLSNRFRGIPGGGHPPLQTQTSINSFYFQEARPSFSPLGAASCL